MIRSASSVIGGSGGSTASVLSMYSRAELAAEVDTDNVVMEITTNDGAIAVVIEGSGIGDWGDFWTRNNRARLVDIALFAVYSIDAEFSGISNKAIVRRGLLGARQL